MSGIFSLQDKTILVAGASSGIGRSTAIMLSQHGAKCVLTGRNHERLSETLAKLDGEGHLVIAGDLTSAQIIDSLVETLPKLDGLFYSAGIASMATLQYMKDETLDEVFDINLFVPMKLTRALIRKKRLNHQASLLFMSSLACFSGRHGLIAYSSAKASLLAMVKVLAKELVHFKIRANCLCPGMVETNMIETTPIEEESLIKHRQAYPLGFGSPEDVAAAAVYFLSPASKWVTGTHLIMDGGAML